MIEGVAEDKISAGPEWCDHFGLVGFRIRPLGSWILMFDTGCDRFQGGESMTLPASNYAIARIDLTGAGTHGWQVRLQRRGVKYAKYFSDRVHGGTVRAFERARRWRDALLRQLEEEESVRVCRRSARNSSGVVGVSKVTVLAANGLEYRFWQATWSPEVGKRRCVKFSVKRYGDRGAFALAVQAREEGAGSRNRK